MRANDRLGGHLVSGHVDGVGTVTRFEPVGESLGAARRWRRASLARFLAYKGSITVNGVSLTVNSVDDRADGCEISINLIPHTVQNTSAAAASRSGSRVNLEIDLIARYVERMLGRRRRARPEDQPQRLQFRHGHRPHSRDSSPSCAPAAW